MQKGLLLANQKLGYTWVAWKSEDWEEKRRNLNRSCMELLSWGTLRISVPRFCIVGMGSQPGRNLAGRSDSL